MSGEKKSLFVTTGAEAVENAIKIARAYTGRCDVIAFHGGFHGRTLLSMALTGKSPALQDEVRSVARRHLACAVPGRAQGHQR